MTAAAATEHNLDEMQPELEWLPGSEVPYRTLFTQSPDGILLIDTDGSLLEFNDAACRQLGYSRAEFSGLRLSDLDPQQKPEEIEASIKEVLRKGRAEFDVQHVTKTGQIRHVHVITQVILLSGRRVFHTIWQDFTERRKLEAEALKTAKLEALGVLAGGLAHDLNNLLTVILGNIGLAKLFFEPSGPAHQKLQLAEQASFRAKQLAERFLTFSTGGAPIRRAITLHEIIRDAASQAACGAGISCEFSHSRQEWPVEADEGQIAQVIGEIVMNSRQAMPRGGTIRVATENVIVEQSEVPNLQEGRYVRISISDDGVGIPEENLSKIFDPYFTTKDDGAGLGLAAAYSIVKRHGGDITVRSSAGGGAVFNIYLPAIPDASVETQKQGSTS